MSIEFCRRTARALLSLGAAVIALACAPGLAAQATHAPPASPADEGEAAGGPRPGDVVRLQIYREPELSGDFVVNESGVVVLPKLGEVSVTSETSASLRTRLVREYEAFLTHSSITVTLLRRVQILGAVRNPGLYPVDATLTIADALALAGGATPEGNPRRVELVRGGRKLHMRLDPSAPLTVSPVRSGDQLFVPERSWLSRNTGIVAAGITASVSLLIALLR